MSDPGITYRSREEVQQVRQERDCIEKAKTRLLQNNWATEAELKVRPVPYVSCCALCCEYYVVFGCNLWCVLPCLSSWLFLCRSVHFVRDRMRQKKSFVTLMRPSNAPAPPPS